MIGVTSQLHGACHSIGEVKAALEQQFLEYSGPYPAAGTFNVDDVIDPRETRPRLIEALELAMGRRVEAPSPVMRHGVLP